jgi:hypothetical protein
MSRSSEPVGENSLIWGEGSRRLGCWSWGGVARNRCKMPPSICFQRSRERAELAALRLGSGAWRKARRECRIGRCCGRG